MRLLCLSNGHGEDGIAVQILQALQQQTLAAGAPPLDIAVLPLVGEGHPYRQAGFTPIGPTQTLPSGGFIYMDGQQLAQDLRGGLVKLTGQQMAALRAWVKQGQKRGFVLAVGDIVPLALAWWSRLPYGFVGTAKSEYYLRDEVGLLPRSTRREQMEGWSGSVYLPWERWLMGRSRCRGVFPRDGLTTEILQQTAPKIKAWNLGNPMMDALGDPDLPSLEGSPWQNCLRVLLLPGSRPPEAYRNWQRLIQGVDSITETYGGRRILFLGAISPGLELDPLREILSRYGWRSLEAEADPLVPGSYNFHRFNGTVQLSQEAYVPYVYWSDVAIAMAGTATEQFAGLGKPIVSLMGEGPQFTPAFAEAQTRLLGAAVTLVRSPGEVGPTLQRLLADPDRLQLIAQTGYQRMGSPGAAPRIAEKLRQLMAP
jgi:uncharacterized protein (TIGR03492 family)